MRALIVCGVLGLALGLAAHGWLRAPGVSASADDTHGAPSRVTDAPVPAQGAVATIKAGPGATEGLAATQSDDEPAPEHEMPDAKRASDLTQKRQEQLRRAAAERELTKSGTIHPLDASSSSAIEQQLRSELGDDDYERYLTAMGQTTRIRVGEVEIDSAAENAGIQAGDEILMYAGKRVFTLRELNALMLRTPAGQTVPTTIVRNGQAIQLYVTGGALGISHQTRR